MCSSSTHLMSPYVQVFGAVKIQGKDMVLPSIQVTTFHRHTEVNPVVSRAGVGVGNHFRVTVRKMP